MKIFTHYGNVLARLMYGRYSFSLLEMAFFLPRLLGIVVSIVRNTTTSTTGISFVHLTDSLVEMQCCYIREQFWEPCSAFAEIDVATGWFSNSPACSTETPFTKSKQLLYRANSLDTPAGFLHEVELGCCFMFLDYCHGFWRYHPILRRWSCCRHLQ